jgi:long-chain fatty acid transport protein
MRSSRLSVILVVAGLSLPAHALTDEEIFRNFRFNLINPGARSLGIGGAFISLADDATAARANPAGLAFLRRWELFAELRSVDNAAQSATQQELLPTDVATSVAVGTNLDDQVSPTFLSGVKTFSRWAIGFSRQELLNLRNETLSGFRFSFPESAGAFFTEGQGFIDVNVVNYNASAGWRITDNFSVGATLTYSRFDVQSEVRNIVLDIGGTVADDDFVYSVGVLYKLPDAWQLGAVYRRGPDFSVIQTVDPAVLDALGQVVAGIDLFDVRANVGQTFLNRFRLPDVWGVGAALFFLPDNRLTFSLDVERIDYSNLASNLVPGVNVLTDFDAEFIVDDATDVRSGAEYLLFNAGNKLPPMALRGGLWLESDSTIRARSTGSNPFATEDVFRGEDDELHVALGLGLIFPRYKIDMAADLADTDNEYLISVIFQGK